VPVAHSTRAVVKHVPPDPRGLGQISQASGGRAYTTGDASRLSQIYRDLGSQLGHVTQRREVTAGFAGAGLALLALGSALSLAWFGRLI
jgi:Ca-activated chloride channel family protein